MLNVMSKILPPGIFNFLKGEESEIYIILSGLPPPVVTFEIKSVLDNKTIETAPYELPPVFSDQHYQGGGPAVKHTIRIKTKVIGELHVKVTAVGKDTMEQNTTITSVFVGKKIILF
jgi:hypothetical protein